MNRQEMDRRTFVSAAMAVAGGTRLSSLESLGSATRPSPQIDAFIRERMNQYDIAGVAACLVKNDRIVWSNTYGFADLERELPMSLDWVQNICSISKTFATTALMQLWEQGRFELDDDVIGRPVHVVEGPDEAFYISDDYAGAIWRVSWNDGLAARSSSTPFGRQAASVRLPESKPR